MLGGYILIAGHEQEKTIHHLMDMANIKSENKREAICDHLVNGTAQTTCAMIYDLGQSTIADAVKRLNVMHAKAMRYHELYCSHTKG